MVYFDYAMGLGYNALSLGSEASRSGRVSSAASCQRRRYPEFWGHCYLTEWAVDSAMFSAVWSDESPPRRSRCRNHIDSGVFWRLVLDLAMFGDHER